MAFIDAMTVTSPAGRKATVELHRDDLLSLAPQDNFDLLVVSAFPDDYTPTPGSLIGALQRKGISVEALSANKAVDLRAYSSCWLSHPLVSSRIAYRRLLCFEPRVRGAPPDVVGDIFRSLAPFIDGQDGFKSLAMPLVASGDQGESGVRMLGELVSAAMHWLRAGMPFERLAIFIHPDRFSEELHREFIRAGKSAIADRTATDRHYDYFISYSWADQEAVNVLVKRLQDYRPDARVFVDRLELQTGSAWQQHIYEAIGEASRIVCCLTPEFLKSKMCQEELNMAILRDRNEGGSLLLPIWMRTANLPIQLQIRQYIDARESSPELIDRAARRISELN